MALRRRLVPSLALVSPALVALLAAAPLAAQQDFPRNPALTRAIATEELEHDAAAALRAYLAIARDDRVDDAVRRHAWLRVAQALPRVPEEARGDVTRRGALQRAADGDDDVAAQARRLLQQVPEDQARQAALHRKAQELIQELLRRPPWGREPGRDPSQGLRWMGADAGPALAEWLRAPTWPEEFSNWSMTDEAAQQLLTLAWLVGGDTVARLLREALADPELQFKPRADSASGHTLRELAAAAITGEPRIAESLLPVAGAYARFHGEPPQIAANAITRVGPWLPLDLLLDEMTDERFAVAHAARSQVDQRLRDLLQTADDDNASKTVRAGALESAQRIATRVATDLPPLLDDPDPATQRDAAHYLPLAMLIRPGRERLLELLPELRLERYTSPLRGVRNLPLPDADAPTELGAWTAKAKLVAELPASDHRSHCYRDVTGRLLATGGRECLGDVLKLYRLGIHDAARWIQRNATDADAGRIIAGLEGNASALQKMLPWLARRDLPEASFGVLRELSQTDYFIEEWLTAIARTGHPEAIDSLRANALAMNDGEFIGVIRVGVLLQHLIRTPTDGGFELLRDFLRAGRSGPFANGFMRDWKRRLVWAALTRFGDLEAIRIYPFTESSWGWNPTLDDIARLISPWPDPPDPIAPPGLQALTAVREVDGRTVPWHGYAPDDFAEAWRILLSEWGDERREAWTTAAELFANDLVDHRLARVLVEAWEQRLPTDAHIPSAETQTLALLIERARTEQLAVELRGRVRDLHEQAFTAPAYAGRELALQMLPRPLPVEARARVVAAFGDPDPPVLETAVDRLLASESAVEREALARALQNTNPANLRTVLQRLVPAADEPVADLVAGSLLDHREPAVRLAACETLGALLDPAAVPALLDALGDPVDEVREAARQALEAIRFHQEQRAHWDAVFSGTAELGDSRAAARLVAQARPDQPAAQRVLAIRSLGVLGEPAALPLLIEWTRDDDSEVAEAARQAIQRLHRDR